MNIVKCLHCYFFKGDKTILIPGSIPSEKIPKTSEDESRFAKATIKRTTKTSLRATNDVDVPIAISELPTISNDVDVSMTDFSMFNDEQGSNVPTTTSNADALTGSIEAVDSEKFICDLCSTFNLKSEVATKTTANASVSVSFHSIMH